MARTALLIRCATEEAEKIRVEADKQKRTISSYVLLVMRRAIQIEDRLYNSLNRYRSMNQVLSRRNLIGSGPRTAVLVRCEVAEAQSIREAARRRDMPINAFVLHALKRVWSAQANAHPAAMGAAAPPLAGTPPATGAAD